MEKKTSKITKVSTKDTSQNFITKNLKWFTIAFAFLFLIKSFQSCNRDNTNQKLEKKLVYVSDSLTNKIKLQNDSITKLNYKLDLAIEKASNADQRANDVKEVAGKITKNTTVRVYSTEQNKSK